MIYFIQAGDKGAVKIGFAKDVEKRFAALQTGNHEELKLLKEIQGEEELEQEIHFIATFYHVRGEWYSPDVMWDKMLKMIIDSNGNLGIQKI